MTWETINIRSETKKRFKRGIDELKKDKPEYRHRTVTYNEFLNLLLDYAEVSE